MPQSEKSDYEMQITEGKINFTKDGRNCEILEGDSLIFAHFSTNKDPENVYNIVAIDPISATCLLVQKKLEDEHGKEVAISLGISWKINNIVKDIVIENGIFLVSKFQMFLSKSFGKDLCLLAEVSIENEIKLNGILTELSDIEELLSYFSTISDYTVGEDKISIDNNSQFLILFGNCNVSIEDLRLLVAFCKEAFGLAKIEKAKQEKEQAAALKSSVYEEPTKS